jgi:gliding motility-associated-like protein
VGQCATNGTLTIVVNPNIIPTFSPVSAICSGAALSALPTISNNAISGSWSPALNNVVTTNYTFTPSLGQCSSNTTLTISVTPFPEFTITQGCNGTDFVLSAIGIGTTSANFIWYNNLHQNIGATTSIIINNIGNYSLELSNNGCSEEKPITVTNIQCSVPKGISPNGDGDNDIFDLSNLNVQRLQIFNRYGIEVFSKINYSNEWIGKSNSGEELPDGTYYFIVTFASGKNKTGWVYINK